MCLLVNAMSVLYLLRLLILYLLRCTMVCIQATAGKAKAEQRFAALKKKAEALLKSNREMKEAAATQQVGL